MQIGAFLSLLLAGAAAFSLGRLLDACCGSASFGITLRPHFYLIELVVMAAVACAALFAAQTAKAIVLAAPERCLSAAAAGILFCARLLAPLSRVVNGLVKRVLDLLHIDGSLDREFALSAEDISDIVEKGSQSGEIEEEQVEMIQGVFGVSDLAVRELMTPRRDIVAVHEAAGLEELVSLFAREGVSRVLVIGDDLDQVRGVVLMKDLVTYVGRTVTDFSLRRILRSAYFVPESKRADELLDEFRKAAVHIAVVLDEHGHVAGVVTLEDLIEEIVGDIFDEYDQPAEEAQIRRTRSGDMLISGGVRLADLNAQTAFDLPQGEYDTVAGFVMHELGHIPRVGEALDRQGLRIRVEGIHQNRITLLRFIPAKKVKVLNKLSADSSEPKATPNESNIGSGQKESGGSPK